MSETIRHLIIRGRVQGVGYRAWMQHIAGRQGLAGWVRNRRDGSVEAVLAGDMRAVREMIDLCRKGPPGARVDAVEEGEGTPAELELRGGHGFAQLPTL